MAQAIQLQIQVDDKGSLIVKNFADGTEKKIKGMSDKSGSHISRMQARFKKLGGGALKLAKKIGALALKFGVLAAAAAAAMGGIIAKKALGEFAAFESAVVDLGKVTSESSDIIRGKMLDMPAVLGNATAMTQGYYATISAGVTEPKAAMDLLTTAAKAGKASHTELAGTIEGMTKMMAGFEGKITSATAASDLLFAIEKEGQTTFSQLIPIIGNVSKLSSDLGVSQQEMAGSLALVTQTAGSTDQAATMYRATLVALMKPTETMKATLKDLGFESSQSAIAQLGLAGTLKALKDSTGGSADKMAELFGRQEALLGMSSLSANGFKNLEQKVEAMGQATGMTEKAFDRYKVTLAAVWDTAKNTVGKQLILIGEKLAPTVSNIVEKTGAWLDKNKELIAGEVAYWLKNIVGWAKEFWPHVKQAAFYVNEWYQKNKGIIALELGKWIGEVAKVAGALADEVLPALLKVLGFLGGAITALYAPFQLLFWIVEQLLKVFGFLIGKIADVGKAMFGFVGKWGNKAIDFVINFFGKGSATLPLSEKISELDTRIAGFADNVAATQPQLMVDCSPSSSAMTAIQNQSDTLAGHIEGLDPAFNIAPDLAESAMTAIQNQSETLAGHIENLKPALDIDISPAQSSLQKLSDQYAEVTAPIRGQFVSQYDPNVRVFSPNQKNFSSPYRGYQLGTDYVPATGIYQLHRGEKVVTAPQAIRERENRSVTAITNIRNQSESMVNHIENLTPKTNIVPALDINISPAQSALPRLSNQYTEGSSGPPQDRGYQLGTNYTPKPGLYPLRKGGQVVPAPQAIREREGGKNTTFGDIYINFSGPLPQDDQECDQFVRDHLIPALERAERVN